MPLGIEVLAAFGAGATITVGAILMCRALRLSITTAAIVAAVTWLGIASAAGWLETRPMKQAPQHIILDPVPAPTSEPGE